MTSRYRQVVAVISCSLANFFTGGVANSYGVLYTYMHQSLEVSEYQFSWIVSLMAGSNGLSGTGLVLTYVATTVHMSQVFSKWMPVATGISISAMGIGILVWPIMTSGIADIMGWRGTLLIQGAVLLHLNPAGLWTVSKHHQEGTDRSHLKPHRFIFNYIRIFKLPGALNFCFSPFCSGVSLYAFSTFIPEYLMVTIPEMTPADASLIISTAGIGSIFGRLLPCVFTMFNKNAPFPVFIISLISCGIAHLAVTWCRMSEQFFITAAFCGITLGCWGAVFPLVLLNQFGVHNMSKMIGIFLTTQGFGALCGPPSLSYMATVTIQEFIFYVAGIFYCLSAASLLPLVFNKKQCVPGRRKSVTLQIFTVTDRQ